jgi:hypothetical protein
MSHDSGPDSGHGGLRESLALYADFLQVGSAGGTVVSFLLWLIGLLPSIALVVLSSFCLGVFFVLMLAKVFISNNEPLSSIGTHLQTAHLEPRQDEAQLIQRQVDAGALREVRQPPAPLTQSGAGDRAEPNLVCGVIDRLPAHEEYGILVKGHAEDDSDAFVYGVRIGNEFDPSRKVGSISDVSAQIFYTSPEGRNLKVLRGTWLSESRYKVDFDVNHEHSLVIVGIPRRVTQGSQLVFYFKREASDSDRGIEDRISALGGDSYQVKIRLINEAEAVVYGEFDYKLTITREPAFEIELTEGL